MKYFFLFIAVVILFNCKPEKEEPKPLTAPVLTTMEAGDITAISALSGGAISSDGGSPVTARGIVWSISHNPTLSDSVSEEGTGIGSFTGDLTPLKYSTTYYVRAYATNSIGTTYGNEITFNTKAAIPSDGLVGWWPFNGNANDESGNGNDGTPENGAFLTADRLGISNSAYRFDGLDDYIQTTLSYTTLLGANGLTCAGWVNLEALDSFWGSSIITNHSPSGTQFAFALAGTNDGINNRKLVAFFNSYNGGSQPIYCPVNPIDFNEWTHVSFTVSSNLVSFYISGNLIYSEAVTYDSLSTEAPAPNVKLGRGNPTPGFLQDWNGSLDDIAIYNRALTAEEIQKIYNGTGF